MKRRLILVTAISVLLLASVCSFAQAKDVKPYVLKGVTIMSKMDTKNEIAKKNMETIVEFFSLYLKDKEKFYSLWVEDEPAVITPFVAEDVAVLKKAVQSGWGAVKGFWDPIFEWKGTFDWQIDEFIVGENPNTIVTLSHSVIDVKAGKAFGNKDVKYNGTYVQIFKFVDGKVKSFEEYYDTALLKSKLGL